LVIVAAAAVFRLQDLSWIPYGISGDEAIFGLEGQRILHEGPIGPYSPFASGQPAGVLYLASASIWALGSTIFAIRLVPAVAGILTVLALYAYGRRNFGVGTGLVGAALLAVSSWHIAISRFAIPLAAWPLVGLLTAGALVEALRARGPVSSREPGSPPPVPRRSGHALDPMDRPPPAFAGGG